MNPTRYPFPVPGLEHDDRPRWRDIDFRPTYLYGRNEIPIDQWEFWPWARNRYWSADKVIVWDDGAPYSPPDGTHVPLLYR